MKEHSLEECEAIISEAIYKNMINAKQKSFEESCKSTPKIILDWQERLKAKWELEKKRA